MIHIGVTPENTAVFDANFSNITPPSESWEIKGSIIYILEMFCLHSRRTPREKSTKWNERGNAAAKNVTVFSRRVI